MFRVPVSFGPSCVDYAACDTSGRVQWLRHGISSCTDDVAARLRSDPLLATVLDDDGNSLVHLAVAADNLPVLDVLLEIAPALARHISDCGRAPLDVAVDGRRLEAVTRLASVYVDDSIHVRSFLESDWIAGLDVVYRESRTKSVAWMPDEVVSKEMAEFLLKHTEDPEHQVLLVFAAKFGMYTTLPPRSVELRKAPDSYFALPYVEMERVARTNEDLMEALAYDCYIRKLASAGNTAVLVLIAGRKRIWNRAGAVMIRAIVEKMAYPCPTLAAVLATGVCQVESPVVLSLPSVLLGFLRYHGLGVYHECKACARNPSAYVAGMTFDAIKEWGPSWLATSGAGPPGGLDGGPGGEQADSPVAATASRPATSGGMVWGLSNQSSTTASS